MNNEIFTVEEILQDLANSFFQSGAASQDGYHSDEEDQRILDSAIAQWEADRAELARVKAQLGQPVPLSEWQQLLAELARVKAQRDALAPAAQRFLNRAELGSDAEWNAYYHAEAVLAAIRAEQDTTTTGG